jgi:hypothetical protein
VINSEDNIVDIVADLFRYSSEAFSDNKERNGEILFPVRLQIDP